MMVSSAISSFTNAASGCPLRFVRHITAAFAQAFTHILVV